MHSSWSSIHITVNFTYLQKHLCKFLSPKGQLQVPSATDMICMQGTLLGPLWGPCLPYLGPEVPLACPECDVQVPGAG